MEKRRTFFSKAIFGCVATMAFTACGGNSTNASDSTERAADTVAVVADATTPDPTEADIALVTGFYNGYVLIDMGEKDSNFAPEKICSSDCQKKLIAANDFEDGSMAIWTMRTGVQDGDGPSKVTSVEPLGDGWYKVSYLDMGTEGSTKVLVKDGVICDYEPIAQ